MSEEKKRDMLFEIVEKKKLIVEKAKQELPLHELKKQVKCGKFSMSQKFRNNKWNLIAECKLQSPSKGLFKQSHTVEELAKIYAANGASMLSVHTDPHFLGKNEDIPMVKSIVDIPVMRKEFIIDEYQIYESRMLGADTVLLIARILTKEQLKQFLYLTWSLGMDALIEVHDEEDMEKALATPAEYIGINNRNLKYFNTTIENTIELLPSADKNRTLISESGIFTMEDVEKLRNAGVDGILVGEGLSTASDVALRTQEFSYSKN